MNKCGRFPDYFPDLIGKIRGGRKEMGIGKTTNKKHLKCQHLIQLNVKCFFNKLDENTYECKCS